MWFIQSNSPPCMKRLQETGPQTLHEQNNPIETGANVLDQDQENVWAMWTKFCKMVKHAYRHELPGVVCV